MSCQYCGAKVKQKTCPNCLEKRRLVRKLLKMVNNRKYAVEALEKQIPKKPIWNKNSESRCCCPNCNEELYVENHHCKCGQALDWSDTDND